MVRSVVGLDSSGRGMSATFSPGTAFAGYRVESLVGRGGMGVVYRATDLSLERPVALKLVAPELAEDERFRARFLREPRLAASLDHPNVIPIYEAGERDGRLYLAMRFVQGSDLKRVLEREGRLAPERALRVLGQVAGALDAAHRRALVHRDVKPANVLIDESGHAYLTDFGVTKQVGGESPDTGRMVGTFDYLAPEQIRGDPVDGRTDVYALGCLLYECVSSAPPFRRATEAQTLWAHMQEEPPPLEGHAALDPVLRKALAKDREHRYPTCSELVDAAGAALGLDHDPVVSPLVADRPAPDPRGEDDRRRRGSHVRRLRRRAGVDRQLRRRHRVQHRAAHQRGDDPHPVRRTAGARGRGRLGLGQRRRSPSRRDASCVGVRGDCGGRPGAGRPDRIGPPAPGTDRGLLAGARGRDPVRDQRARLQGGQAHRRPSVL
jgi:serine/threonine protein kinase